MAPRVTIGLPVRNGQRFITQAIESVLAQDYSDFEMVICDNASDDATTEIVRRYASTDARIKLIESESNIGQLANMNLAFELGSGEYFRWMGDDDWMEPNCLSKCVEYLDREPDVIAVETYVRYFDDEGNDFYLEYMGERLGSPEAHRRFSRMLWFLRSDYRYCDPHYSLYRRSALQKTHLLQATFAADRVLAAELSLVGRFGHIPECLFHRRRVPSRYDDKKLLHGSYNPDLTDELRPSWARLCANFGTLVSAASLTTYQKAVCSNAIARFFLAQEMRGLNVKARRAARRVPGYERIRAAARR